MSEGFTVHPTVLSACWHEIQIREGFRTCIACDSIISRLRGIQLGQLPFNGLIDSSNTKRSDFMASHYAHHYPTTSFHTLYNQSHIESLPAARHIRCHSAHCSNHKRCWCPPTKTCLHFLVNRERQELPTNASTLQIELQALSSDQRRELPTAHHLIFLCAQSPCAIKASWCGLTSAHNTRIANWALKDQLYSRG
jgi:hypothetical protein